MRLPTLLRLPALVLLLAGAAGVAQAADYQVTLARTSTVGERYAVVSTGSQEQHVAMTVAGAPMPARDQALAVEFSAKAEVLAVTADGRETTTAFTVTAATVTRAGVPGQLLPAGAVVTADSTGGKTTFTVDGAPAAPEVAQALELAVRLPNPKGKNDDEIFGTSARQKVGDSWPVNAAAAAADMAKDGQLQVDPANIIGRATLVGIVPSGSQQALKITATMELTKVGLPLPPGMTVNASGFTAQFSGLFPADPAKRSLAQAISLEGHFDCAGKAQGQDLTMVMTMKQKADATFTY